MIVYNVARKWFTMKDDAERHRKTAGLKPDQTVKLDIKSREELALLLNALCEASPKAVEAAQAALPDVPVGKVVDRAFVDPETDLSDIPAFLLKGTPSGEEELKRRSAGKDVFG